MNVGHPSVREPVSVGPVIVWTLFATPLVAIPLGAGATPDAKAWSLASSQKLWREDTNYVAQRNEYSSQRRNLPPVSHFVRQSASVRMRLPPETQVG